MIVLSFVFCLLCQDSPTVLRRPAAAASAAKGKRKAVAPPELPPGWTVQTVVRKSGESKGAVDKYYKSPSGKLCRSWREVHAACTEG